VLIVLFLSSVANDGQDGGAQAQKTPSKGENGDMLWVLLLQLKGRGWCRVEGVV